MVDVYGSKIGYFLAITSHMFWLMFILVAVFAVPRYPPLKRVLHTAMGNEYLLCGIDRVVDGWLVDRARMASRKDSGHCCGGLPGLPPGR